jgi:preprotein translocase subunit YajC
MLLISPIIPITIYFYSELIKKQEKDEPKRKRRRRNVETGELEDVEEEN